MANFAMVELQGDIGMDIERVKAMAIEDLGLSVRSYNCLRREGIYSVRDILEKIKTPEDFNRVRNLGKKSSEEIYIKLDTLDISLFVDNYTDEEELNSHVTLRINEIGLPETVTVKLEEAGIATVSDLMYELVADSDIIRMGLNELDVSILSRVIRSMNLKLGIFDEPISCLCIWDSLNNRLENEYVDIQGILQAGFSNIIDTQSDVDAIRTAKRLRKMGYLLAGYPGWDNPETCKKLRSYILGQPLTFLELSSDIVNRMVLAEGKDVHVGYFAQQPVWTWFGIIQNFEDCVLISEKLQRLCIHSYGISDLKLGKEQYLRNNTVFYSPFEEFQISKRLYHTLIGKGIGSVEQLVAFSAEELRCNLNVGEAAMTSIRKALYNGRLLLRNDFVLKCERCNEHFVSDDISRNICDECIAKRKRISKLTKLNITISGPDYGSYFKLSSGFALFANMKNMTTELLTVRLIDFYVVERDKQISPKYFLDGYSFDEEMIMPGTVKSAGKIWDIERFLSSSSLGSSTYAVLSVKVLSEEHKRMFKFVYKGYRWEIDDYYIV